MWVDGTHGARARGFRLSVPGPDRAASRRAGGRSSISTSSRSTCSRPRRADALIDPALAPVDSTARTRIGYRVRCAPTLADTCQAAWDGLTTVAGSTGTLTIDRVAPAAPADPCAPPGDPLGQLPDGLFRVEVIDPGGAGSARFAWSYKNGAAAVAVEASSPATA